MFYRFILMLEEGDTEKSAMYDEWIRVYDMSIRECHNNNKEAEAVTEDEEEWMGWVDWGNVGA